MNFKLNKPYSSLQIARELAKRKKCILIYAYWTDYDQYERFDACDSFVLYKYTTMDEFLHYLINFIKEEMRCNEYELEDKLTHDHFQILVKVIFTLIVENFPKKVEINDEYICKFFLDNFPHIENNYEQ